jgi:hypothetical protein
MGPSNYTEILNHDTYYYVDNLPYKERHQYSGSIGLNFQNRWDRIEGGGRLNT